MTEAAFDVVVVGAGTAGANAAYQFARRGRRVMLIERRPAALAGAQWHNGVLDRHFVRAGLEPPSGEERCAEGGTVHLRARDPRIGPTLRDAPTVRADMALLGRRLRGLAEAAGVELIDEVRQLEVRHDEGNTRIRSLVLRDEAQRVRVKVTASLFVDASGRTGVLRRNAPELEPWCPAVRGDELCTASDAGHEVADAAGAEEFLARHGAEPGDAVTVVGPAGGFSTCSVTVAEDLTRVGILVGCLANGRYSTGTRMLAELREREAWIGPAITNGTGIIPLRRPFARFTAPGLALVGDAACQVFPAHGSGIGVGLVAATMLAEAVADLDDPGAPDGLWSRYQSPFQRELGADLAGYDMLRRASTRLGGSGVDELLRSGVMDETTTRSGLDQRWATPSFGEVGSGGLRLARHPRLAAVMVPALVRAQLLRAHTASYPEHLDVDALARWEHRASVLLGGLPR